MGQWVATGSSGTLKGSVTTGCSAKPCYGVFMVEEVSLQFFASSKDMKSPAMLVSNSAMAAALNIASFETSKRCGGPATAISVNLKQVLLLAVPLDGKLPGFQVMGGTFMTVGGSIWYVFERITGE